MCGTLLPIWIADIILRYGIGGLIISRGCVIRSTSRYLGDKYYVLCHRQTNRYCFSRQACAEYPHAEGVWFYTLKRHAGYDGSTDALNYNEGYGETSEAIVSQDDKYNTNLAHWLQDPSAAPAYVSRADWSLPVGPADEDARTFVNEAFDFQLENMYNTYESSGFDQTTDPYYIAEVPDGWTQPQPTQSNKGAVVAIVQNANDKTAVSVAVTPAAFPAKELAEQTLANMKKGGFTTSDPVASGDSYVAEFSQGQAKGVSYFSSNGKVGSVVSILGSGTDSGKKLLNEHFKAADPKLFPASF